MDYESALRERVEMDCLSDRFLMIITLVSVALKFRISSPYGAFI
jgi:hypothetical protein